MLRPRLSCDLNIWTQPSPAAVRKRVELSLELIFELRRKYRSYMTGIDGPPLEIVQCKSSRKVV